MFKDFKNPLIYEEKDLDIASVAKGMPTLSSYSLQTFSTMSYLLFHVQLKRKKKFIMLLLACEYFSL